MFVVWYPDEKKYLANGRYGKTTTDLQEARTFSATGPAKNAANNAGYYLHDWRIGVNGQRKTVPWKWELVEVRLSFVGRTVSPND